MEIDNDGRPKWTPREEGHPDYDGCDCKNTSEHGYWIGNPTSTWRPAGVGNIKHVVFNPMTTTLFVGPLDSILKREEAAGWRLDQIIPHHQYESVAVFVRSSVEHAPEIPTVKRGY